MAESQLMCMEDGHIGDKVPESRPEFYYSEEQRAAIEELLKNGDGAFKTRLKDDNMKDFLSAREIRLLLNTFRSYDSDSGSMTKPPAASWEEEGEEGGEPGTADDDSGVHSTYWPLMSDTEVPPLDNGWPSGAMFKGVTRVAVHTHPPKDNGPHIKQVVRRLIQEASKVIAIVMDLLTDVQILQDLMDAAWRRSVPVYILLDEQGVPHFLDMCSRLQIGAHHLRNIRCRVLQGVGFALSFGRLPGSVTSKYMLVDGDRVVFGSYSFAWCTSRMDRNMITVMTGQVVDFFDRDFRELYAISEKLNLYKEFHVSPPAARPIDTTRSRSESKRPPLPATTSRFQVTLGDSRKAKIEVPAHKFYNPKYALVFGDIVRPTGSLQEPGPTRISALAHPLEDEDPDKPRVTSSEKVEKLSPLPAEAPSDIFKKPKDLKTDKKGRLTLRAKLFRHKSSSRPSISPLADPKPAEKDQKVNIEDSFDVLVISPPRVGKVSKKPSRLTRKATSEQAVNSAHDNEGFKLPDKGKQPCKVS